MYLKSIEMQGFKSFADKITLEFNDGVTGIVGPNGSGKSNISDAVRWVLGEQSARQLRGANMQDVIFSGTETRKPVSYAYVSLTLNNTDRQLAIDSDEVTVSRRVYRSGESEYSLNGSQCRLRDVQELFYDTGIGQDGYSIIGQGQIDRILSGKPEERRELFDEAAGIVKFKKRKLTAQKKLESEHLNRLRVKDILLELEKQVGPLAKQSEKAKQYLRYKDECRRYDLQQFAADNKQNAEKILALASRRETVAADLNANQEKQEKSREAYDVLAGEAGAIEETILGLQNKKSELHVARENREGKIRLLEEQARHLATTIESRKERLEQIRVSLEEKDQEIQAQKDEKEKLKAQAEEEMNALDLLKEDLQVKEKEQEEEDKALTSLQEEVIRLLNEKAELSAKGQHAATVLEQSALRITSLKEQLIHAQTEEEAHAKEKQELEEALKNAETDLEQIKVRQAQIVEIEGTLVKEREEAREKLAKSNQNFERAASQYESLRNLSERYEGFGGSTRRIMEQKETFPGVLGTVADLISTDKRYELAIETALGGALQNIVTDNEQTARACVDFLKENKYGRSTFLPLANIQEKDFSRREALKERGAIGLGSDLLKAPDTMRHLPSYLLGNVLVVDDMDAALAIARKYRYDFRIVTLDGDLLNRGGSITGGAFRSNSNLLGRRRELEELKNARDKWEKSKNEAEAKEKEISETLSALRLEKDTLREKLVLSETSVHTARVSRENLEKQEVGQEAGKKEIQEEIARLTKESGAMRIEQGRLKSQMGNLDDKRQEVEDSIYGHRDALAALTKARDEAQTKYHEKNALLASLAQQDRFLDENVKRLENEKIALEKERTACEATIGSSADDETSHQEEKKKLTAEAEKLAADLEALEAELSEALEKRQENTESQKRCVHEREQLADEASALEKESLRLEHQQERLEEGIESQADYLWTEYGLTPSEGLKAAEENPPEEKLEYAALKRKIGSIKNAMKELGNINVNAIEEYREVSERYTFLKKQHDDLEEAEERLKQVIEELDEGMKRQFKEKFEQIRVEFNKVFRELFGGGKGELDLLEPENILESGIQIIAQPPGKKLVNMMQMSGGEKALTAISILFAIQNLKPSPFCLLDEIEAALDDANVSRYADYLKKLTKYTQFITITHRRGTMLAADRLYGITMQEKGISTLVSVNMTDE